MSKHLGAAKLIGATKHRGRPDPSLVLFRDRPQTPINGVRRLPAAMTINGVTEYPVLRYTAGGELVNASTWSPWGYGEDLSVVAVATPPTLNNGSPAVGPYGFDDSVLFNASDYFQAGNNTFADITTEDFVIECVVRYSSAVATGTLLGKRNGVAPFEGYSIRDATNCLALYIDTGPTVITNLTTPTLTNRVWYHLIVFVDRSGSAVWYADGTAGTARAVSALSASITTANPLLVGTGGGSSAGDHALAYWALWKRASWLDTHLQATIAEQRASLFWGWRPQQARGTAVPTARTRASNAYLDKMEYDGTRKLYLVGNNVPRAVSRLDKNGAEIKGYLPEVQITNLCLRSEEIDVDGAGSPWTHTRASVTNTSTTTLPNGVTSVNDVIHEDATAANTHSITQSISVVSGTKYVFSGWFKAINRSFVMLNSKNGGAAWSVTFNLTTGAAGATGASITDKGVISYGNGWYRCWISYTMNTTAAVTHYALVAEADNDVSFNGLDQDSIYCWGVQLEAGVDYPTSYMPTAAAAVIREEDVLRYKGDDGNLGGVGSNKTGEIRFRMLNANYDLSVAKTIVDISDGGAAADHVEVTINTSDQVAVESAASGGSAGLSTSTTDVVDDAVHQGRVRWQQDNLGPCIIDGSSEGSADTDADMPDELDRIDIGCDLSSLVQPNAVLADIEIFPRVLRE